MVRTAGLQEAADGYLKVRRSLGYKMARPEKLLAQFTSYLEQARSVTVTTEHALAWSVLLGRDPRSVRPGGALRGPP